MSDSASITFEVTNVRRVRRGAWMADVLMDFDGVPLRLNGFRVVQEKTCKSVELPAFVDRGSWRPAMDLPEELRLPLARAIVREIEAMPATA